MTPQGTGHGAADLPALAPETGADVLARGPADPRYHFLPRCASTNDEAVRLGRAGAPEGTVVVAGEQERGRGRLGHRWHSPAGDSLYLSVLLRPPLSPARAPLLTLLGGVAVAEAVGEVLAGAAAVELKWPNDLFLAAPGAAPRKAAGVLTEMVTSGERVAFVIIGIGVNLLGTEFPPDLAGRATSLLLEGGCPVTPAAFAPRLLARLEARYREFLAEGPAPLLRRFAAHAPFLQRGRRILVRGPGGADGPGEAGALRGVPEGLAADGALLLRDDGGVLHRVIAGEVAEVAP